MHSGGAAFGDDTDASLMENAVAWVLRGPTGFEHATPILHDLYWLPNSFCAPFSAVFDPLEPCMEGT